MEESLIHFRVQNRELTNELDEAIRDKMYSFYKTDYTLDTIEQSSSDISGFIEQYIEESKRRNKEQGTQGVYHGYGYSPFIYINKMLRQVPSLLKESISHEVYLAACETVLNDKQTIGEKIAAVDIMIYLVCNVPSIPNQYVELNTRIQNETERVLLGHSMLTNLDKQHLFVHVLFLYGCFKQDISIRLIEILAENQEDVLFALEACKVVDLFIEESKTYLSESLEHIILQNAIRWCNMTNSDIRWYSISVLFKLLVKPQHIGIITKQIVHMMDVDDMHVKISILRRSRLLLTHDKSTYEYILQKARVDPNYLVRKVGQEILAE